MIVTTKRAGVKKENWNTNRPPKGPEKKNDMTAFSKCCSRNFFPLVSLYVRSENLNVKIRFFLQEKIYAMVAFFRCCSEIFFHKLCIVGYIAELK